MGAGQSACCVPVDKIDDEYENLIEEKRIILSPIIKQEDADDWRYRAYLIPHEPIRDGLNILVEITDSKYYQLNIDELKIKIDKVYTWYNNIFYFFVHHHHDAEERIYFPFVVEKCKQIPLKLTKDHQQLMKTLTDIKDLQNKFNDIFNSNSYSEKEKENEFKKELQELNILCIQLKQDTDQHLNEEEECIPKLLKQYKVKEEEQNEIVAGIRKELGLNGNKIMLPWIIDCMFKWGGKTAVDRFKSNIPAPIVFINYMYWTTDYENNNKKVIQDIMSDWPLI